MIESQPGTERTAWEGPEERTTFRLAQLSLLLTTAAHMDIRVTSLDRLAYFDFFSANPFIVLDGRNPDKDTQDRLTLHLSGFSPGQLTYGSIGHRFTTRKQRLRHDLALLVSRGLVRVSADRYSISPAGLELTSNLRTVYSDAYRTAAAIVLQRFGRMPETKLRKVAERLLGTSWLLIDFLADVDRSDAITLKRGKP